MENVWEMFIDKMVDTAHRMAMNFVVLTNSPVVSATAREKLTSDFIELTVEIFRANSIEPIGELGDDLDSRITDLVNGLHADFQMARTTARNIG